MKCIRPCAVGHVFSTFFAVNHAGWSTLIGIGWAQALLDFNFRLHMIEPAYRITDFRFGTALSLVLLTSGIGYIMGWLLAILWNSYCLPRATECRL